MKLFYSPGACSLAPHILLEDIGAPYELALVSVAEGRTQSPECLAINPKGRVPALDCEPGLLTKAPAILMYLAQSHPDKRLLPTQPGAFARAAEWFNWLSGELHGTGFGALWRPLRYVEDAALAPDVGKRGLRTVLEGLGHIESRLDGESFALGGDHSAVDPYLLVFYRWGNRIGRDMRRDYPRWTRHAERVAARPATARALAQENIAIW